MKVDAKKLYGNNQWEWFDYQPMLNAFGNIVLRIDDRGYQGDSRVLYDNDGKIGFLLFGWGSCSGCDALQACGTIEEVQQLCDNLQNDIKWFEDKETAHEWFCTHDWEGDYSWYEEETREFVSKAKEYLKGE